MSSRKTIAKNLRALRAYNGTSQAQLAEKSGVSIAQIKRIELSKTDTTVMMLNKIAAALGVKTTRLIKENKE